MIPVRDINPTHRRPVLTILIIAINVLVFLYEVMLPEQAQNARFMEWGVVPYRIVNELDLAAAMTLITSMFMHGGWMHILSNMLYLLIFGDNVEDALGHARYLIVYLACGVGAALAQVAVAPDSQVPAIGASGAIAGMLGAYMVFYPTARVESLVFFGFFARLVSLPAVLVLGSWFVLQFFSGVASLGITQTGGVAWFAHIGGFVLGLVVGGLCRLTGCQPRRLASGYQDPYSRYPRSYDR